MTRLALVVGLLGLLAGPVLSDGLVLIPSQRAAFGALVRQAILDDPTPVARAFAPPDPYAAERSADLALIATHGVALFGVWPAPRRIAFFAAADCPDCDRAALELDALAKDTGWTVLRHDAGSDLARDIGVPDAPFYVLPELMIRGWMPAPALARYLN